MGKFKILGMVLIVVFALSALGSSSAFGAPIGQLVSKTNGVVAGPILVSALKPQVLETLASVKVTCQKADGKGEAINFMKIVVKGVIFNECVKSTGGTCKTAGAGAGNISIGTLNVLVVVNEAETEDLLLTELGTEVEFECAEVKAKVKNGGKFLATVSPNVGAALTNKFAISAACSTAGMQTPTKYREFGTLKTISEAEGLLAKLAATGAFEGACQSGEAEALLNAGETGKLV